MSVCPCSSCFRFKTADAHLYTSGLNLSPHLHLTFPPCSADTLPSRKLLVDTASSQQHTVTSQKLSFGPPDVTFMATEGYFNRSALTSAYEPDSPLLDDGLDIWIIAGKGPPSPNTELSLTHHHFPTRLTHTSRLTLPVTHTVTRTPHASLNTRIPPPGQSNAVGENPHSRHLPCCQPIPGKLLTFNMLNNAANAWSDAAPCVGCISRGANPAWSVSCGPELAFGRVLLQYGASRRVGFVPTAWGGTSLHDDW